MMMNTVLFLAVNRWAGKSRALDVAMIFCAKYLIYFVFLAAIFCIVSLVIHRKKSALLFFFSTLLINFALLQIAALTYAEFFIDKRPFVTHHVTQLISHVHSRTFPSDHVTAVMAIAMGLLLFTGFRKTGIIIAAAALAIGFARVFCGVHYPADVVGGAVIAIVGAGIIKAVQHRVPKLFYEQQYT